MNDTLTVERKAKQLLRDFGYTVNVTDSGVIVRATDSRVSRTEYHCRDWFDAIERFIPIIRDEEFYQRARQLRNPEMAAEAMRFPEVTQVVKSKPERRKLTATQRFVRAVR